MDNEIRVPISSDVDIVSARRKGRELAVRIGFSASDSAVIATAISELARNILRYAGNGHVTLTLVRSGTAPGGIVVVAHDDGPGIADVASALEDGYSTSRGLGLGLPGVRRLMDEFEIASEIGRGTTVTVKKWRP